MRFSVVPHRDREIAIQSLVAAARHGVNLFDTAPSYGLGEWDEHHNERLLREALAVAGEAREHVRIATKVGLVREGAAWVPDGRAKAIRASCEASLQALDRSVLDFVLLHAIDPRTNLEVSLRALTQLKEQGLAREIGICNVSCTQLELAQKLAPISAVQLAWSPFDLNAQRAGTVRHALAAGLLTMVHSPFGGPKRAARLAKNAALLRVAEQLGVPAHTALLALHYATSPLLVPLPGAGRLETAIEAGRAARVSLTDEQRSELREALSFDDPTVARAALGSTGDDAGEIVMLVGIQAAGKSSAARTLAEQGYLRLNRDERGGTLAGIAKELQQRLEAGERRIVLDNTYVTRAQRGRVLELAAQFGVPVRAVYFNIALEVAQVRAVRRMLEAGNGLLQPEALRAAAKTNPHAFPPMVQLRTQRELEPPRMDEGYSAIDEQQTARPTERLVDPTQVAEFEAVAILADCLAHPGLSLADSLRAWRTDLAAKPLLVFAWCLPEHEPQLRAQLDSLQELKVDNALCAHGGGPPLCWCRPPLPGLLLSWAQQRGIALERCLVIGSGPAHRAMARAVGAAFSLCRTVYDSSGSSANSARK
jgi:aryl-alcohol dehydrogenase-like predicted oxidoreductase/predicted kinase